MQKVRREANRLKREKYNVKATLPDFEKPAKIGKDGSIPDVEATKRGVRKIIEVETPDSLGKDKKQHETFRRSAGQRKRTTFEIKVTKKRK